jgi:hypothetical protein
MEGQRTKRRVLTLVIVGIAVLLGAILGRAQSVFPVRLDDPTTAAITTAPSWAKMGGIHLEPQDKPPVRCNAANVGFFYIQGNFQGTLGAPLVSSAPCYCASCVGDGFCTGTTGYADAGFIWQNTVGPACAQLWELEP